MISLSSQLMNATRCLSRVMISAQRTLYASSGFGIDSFERYSKVIENDHGKNFASIKATIQQAVAKPDSNVFTEDLKVFLYLAKEESDFNLLLEGIRKYLSSILIFYRFFYLIIPLCLGIVHKNQWLFSITPLTHH